MFTYCWRPGGSKQLRKVDDLLSKSAPKFKVRMCSATFPLLVVHFGQKYNLKCALPGFGVSRHLRVADRATRSTSKGYRYLRPGVAPLSQQAQYNISLRGVPGPQI